MENPQNHYDLDHEPYSERELESRREARQEAKKHSVRKFVAGIAVGAALFSGAVAALRGVESRMDKHATEVERAQEPLEQHVQEQASDNAAHDPRNS